MAKFCPQQMGYQPGKGLGKALQGISAPVEAHLRKGRGAIGKNQFMWHIVGLF